MISALLSDFDRLTTSQRATVTHWIIDDPDRLPSAINPTFDIETEQREGYAYDRD